jgi:hypothetical protein
LPRFAGGDVQQYTIHRMEIPWWLKVVNGLVRLAGWLGLPFGKLDGGSILTTASKKTKLYDWGDRGFIDIMERLMLEADAARITPLGEIVLRQASLAAVMNRLRIEDYINRHPEVLDIPIEKPVFIVGFPRTGTTLLQNLLSLDEGSRALQFWELYNPVPVDEDPAEDRRKRIAEAARVLRAARVVAPEMPIVHDISATSKEEDWTLFCNTFAVMNHDLASGVSRFGDWLLQRDMTQPYREFRRYLQVLAHWHPTKRFILKCPEHLWFLDALFEVFPDANIVWPHRDPATCIASYASMISLTRRAWFGRIYAGHIGLHVADRFREGITRAMQVRERIGEERFADTNFNQLVADPHDAVRGIKEHFGIPHDERSDQAIREWLTIPRTDNTGKHVYSPQQWGLEPESIHSRYADYIERFDIDLGRRKN